MIFVATGTHHQPFDRLVREADRVAATLKEPVVIQRGASEVAAPHCEVYDRMTVTQFADTLARARIVVLHGGSSTFLQAEGMGHTPIVVPRDPRLGEHVDDHQQDFGASLGPRVHLVTDVRALAEVIAAHPGVRSETDPELRSQRFCSRFGAVADALIRR